MRDKHFNTVAPISHQFYICPIELPYFTDKLNKSYVFTADRSSVKCRSATKDSSHTTDKLSISKVTVAIMSFIPE